MSDLREHLSHCLRGNVCLVGVGNTGYGDDGLGLRLAEAIAGTGSDDSPGRPNVIVAGTTPEAFMSQMTEGGFDNLVFLDAVEIGAAPGSVVLLDSEEMSAKFPQISTHKISLGLLARFIEMNGTTRAWLLGIQPESLASSETLSKPVRETIELLNHLLRSLWHGERSEAPENRRTDDETQRWNHVIP